MLKTNPSVLNVAPSVAKASPSWLGWVLGLCATAGFSIATPLSRSAILSGLTPTNLLLGRLIISSVLLGLFLGTTKPASLKLDRRGLLVVALVGITNGISTFTFYEALRYLDASLAIMLFAANPVMVLGLLALRGEKLTYRHLIRVALALGGVYLLAGPGGSVSVIGVLLVLATIVFFAFQLVGVQWYLQGYDSSAVTFYIATFATLVTLAWWGVQGEAWYVPDAQGWMTIVLLAVVSTFLARLCFYKAIQLLGSGQMSLLMPTETLLAVIWSLLFLGERLTIIQWVGAGLILTSAMLAIQRLGRVRWPQRWRAVDRI
ncbi:MAG: DMT family transporter [Caldilineaceae bacterium]